MGYEEVLFHSPVRKIVEQSEQETVFEDKDDNNQSLDVKGRLTDTRKIIRQNDINESRRDEPITVAVVGEVKAGKSTFINACLAREVAYMAMAEATAAVSQISYSKTESFTINMKNGEKKEFLDEGELVDFMDTNSEDRDFWKKVDKINICIDDDLLNNVVLVDTPGLLTITSENKEVTSKYIYNSDVLLWVLDSQDLGSSIVIKELEEKSRFGKKIIGIINKIDSDEGLDEIQNYVRVHYGRYFDEIFYVSGLNAWLAENNEDEELYEKSNMDAVLGYIRYLGENSENIRLKSIQNSNIVQFEREENLHKLILEKMKCRKKVYDQNKAVLEKMHNKMTEAIKEELQYWINHVFLGKECKELLDCKESEYERLISKYSSGEYIDSIINKEYQKLQVMVCDNWTEMENAICTYNQDSGAKVDMEWKSGYSSEKEKADKDKVISGAIEGGKIGVGVAAGVAGYLAWLGPAAATVTFTSALAGIAIPTIGMLSLVGGYKQYNRSQNGTVIKASERKKDVEGFEKYTKTYVREQHYNIIKNKLVDFSNQLYQKQLEMMPTMAQQMNFNFEDEEFNSFISDVEEYIEALRLNIKDLQEEAISVIPYDEANFL